MVGAVTAKSIQCPIFPREIFAVCDKLLRVSGTKAWALEFLRRELLAQWRSKRDCRTSNAQTCTVSIRHPIGTSRRAPCPRDARNAQWLSISKCTGGLMWGCHHDHVSALYSRHKTRHNCQEPAACCRYTGTIVRVSCAISNSLKLISAVCCERHLLSC
jgi:hypothetical protein